MYFSGLAQPYTVAPTVYAPYSTAGTIVWPGPTIDDAVLGPFPIGFTFCFFGTNYTQFYVGSNGWIGFSPGQPATFTSSPIPSVAASTPKNCIMGPWQDWYAVLSGVGAVKYQTIGEAPCRKLVVTFDQTPFFSCTSVQGTFQMVLNEGSNIVENVLVNKPACLQWAGGTAVQGLHDITGTIAVTVPGRNSTQWVAQNESWIYTPNPSSGCSSISGGTDSLYFLSQDLTTAIPPAKPTYILDCESDSLMIYFSAPVNCNSVSTNASELRLINSLNQSYPIVSQTAFCDSLGRTDSVLIKFLSPVYQNGRYYIITKDAIDGDTYTGGCGKIINQNDTIEINVTNCYEYSTPLDLINVTVLENKDIEVTWKTPANFDTSYFQGYKVLRNMLIYGGSYNLLSEVSSYTDTVFLDLEPSVNVAERAYDYQIVLKVRRNPDTPPSDSIASIFLQNTDGLLNGDTPVVATLAWNSYWGWPNPSYGIYIKDDSPTGTWSLVGTTTDTTFGFLAEDTPGNYCLKINTQDTVANLQSESNWLCFSIIEQKIDTPAVIIPNIITPNGDGINDTWVITNIDFHPDAEISVTNRWGTPVLKTKNYQNDWTPAGNVSPGIYYYVISFPNGENKQGTLTILK